MHAITLKTEKPNTDFTDSNENLKPGGGGYNMMMELERKGFDTDL